MSDRYDAYMAERIHAQENAESWIVEAQKQNHQLHPALVKTLIGAVKVNGLTQAGLFSIVDTLNRIERAEGRLPARPESDGGFMRDE